MQRWLFFSLGYFLFASNLVLTLPILAEASNFSKESASYQNYLKGLLFDEEGKFEQAKKAYQRASAFDTEAWDIHYKLGLEYIRLKNFKKAEKELKLVLKLKPYNERVRFLLGLVYSYNEKYRLAVSEYQKLLEAPLLELNEIDIRYSLAQLYFTQDNLSAAENEYKIILEKSPFDSYAHFYLGYIYTEFSKIDSAIEEFKHAIELSPENHLALNSLSYLYAESGQNLDDALILIGKALEFEPANGAYLDTLGWIYFKKGDLEKALRYLENASVLENDAEIFQHLGDVYFEVGKFQEAKKNWQKSIKIDPERKEVKDKLKKALKNPKAVQSFF